jgi:hypothetical protein
MNATSSKISFNKADYYFIVFLAVVLLGFWDRYFSQLIAGFSHNANYFHFHGVIALVWIAMLIVQPILIRRKKLGLHRLIGKLSFLVMPLLIISLLMVTHYLGVLTNSELNFIDVTIGNNVGGGIGIVLFFYIIAMWNRHDVNIHARAMIATAIPFIDPALARLLLGLFPHIPPTIITPITFSSVSILLIILIIAERKVIKGRWIFPTCLAINVVFSALLYTGTVIKIPVIDPAFGKWFKQLPLTKVQQMAVKDLPIPKNEIDAYFGTWDLKFFPFEAITYKKSDQLWIRLEEASKNKLDSTKLLYQGDGKFVLDKDLEFVKRGPGKHLSSLNFQLKNGKAESFTPYYGYTNAFVGRVKRKN